MSWIQRTHTCGSRLYSRSPPHESPTRWVSTPTTRPTTHPPKNRLTVQSPCQQNKSVPLGGTRSAGATVGNAIGSGHRGNRKNRMGVSARVAGGCHSFAYDLIRRPRGACAWHRQRIDTRQASSS